MWGTEMFACGLGAGLGLLIRAYRWYALALAVIYLPLMYVAMIWLDRALVGC